MKTVADNGHTLAEYFLMIIIIAIIVVIILGTLGGYIKDGVTRASCYIGKDTYVESTNPGDAYCKNK